MTKRKYLKKQEAEGKKAQIIVGEIVIVALMVVALCLLPSPANILMVIGGGLVMVAGILRCKEIGREKN